MSIQEYISSGVLDLYAVGALSEAEAAEVEQMVRLHPEVRAELETIQQVLETYALAHEVAPPAHLKANVMAAIAATAATPFKQPVLTASSNTVSEQTENTISNTPEAKVVPMQSSSFNWMSIAASVLLAVSVLTNLYFYNKWRGTEQQLALAQTDRQQMAVDVTSLRNKQTSYAQQMDVLSNPATVAVLMRGSEKTPALSAKVYWNPENKQVLLDASRLPEPPNGKQYQLWAMVNGVPVDAGVFDPQNITEAGLQQMKLIEGAQAFAVTLEPTGGRPTPTLEELQMIGAIAS